MNILIVEDEPLVALSLKRICSTIPMVHQVSMANTVAQASGLIASGIFDLYVVDIMLEPDSPVGLDLCRVIRNKFPKAPIIVLTAMDSMEYLEKAFEIGVNEYLTKPFHTKELIIRMKRWFGQKQGLPEPVISYGKLAMDLSSNEVTIGSKHVHLTRRQKHLLSLFIKSPEALLKSSYIIEKYWGDYSDRNRNLRSTIQHLRRSLGNPISHWIKTVRGEGFLLKK